MFNPSVSGSKLAGSTSWQVDVARQVGSRGMVHLCGDYATGSRRIIDRMSTAILGDK